MKPTGLQKLVVELPFTGKLDQKEASEVRPMLDLQTLTNVDLSEPGKIKRRTGYEDVSIAMFDGLSFGNVQKLAARGDELVSLQNTQITLGSGGGTGNAGDSIVSYSPGANRWKNHGKIPRPTLRKILTNREGNSNSTSCAVTADGKYMILVWAQDSFRYSGGIGQGILAQVYDVSVSPPVLIEDTKVLDSTNTTTPILVKCVALANGSLVVTWNYSGTGSAFAIMVSGYNTTTFTWQNIVNISPAPGIDYDICAYDSTSFVLATRYDLSATTIIRQITNSGANYSSTATLVSGVAFTGEAYAIHVSNGTIFAAASNGNAVRVYRATSLAGYTQDGIALASSVIGGPPLLNRVGIVGTSASDAWVFWWNRGIVGATPTGTKLTWCKTVNAAASGVNHQLFGVTMTHAPFNVSGRVYVPICGSDPEVNTGIYHTRFGYGLFEIDTANPANQYATGIVAGAWATDIGNHKIGFGVLGIYQYCLRGCLAGSQYFQPDFVVGEVARGRHYGTTTTPYTLDALDVIRLEFADAKRWESREHDGQTVFAGAVPWVYDGSSGFECGWVWRPRILRAVDVGGGLLAGGTYTIRVVYEFLDGDQRYWYSSPSYEVELGEAKNTVTVAGPTGNIQLYIRPPSFTAMDKSYTNQTIRPRILVFITFPSGGFGAQEFFLKEALDFNPQLGSYITLNISQLTSDFGTNDHMYTDGGELENYGPPPCRVIEKHRDRLVAFSEYDFRIWYTKPSAYARGVEWVLEQTIAPPDEITALASMESALICFTKNSIYALEGQGPSPTGLPPDAFARLVLITAEVGCVETNACARTPVGVLFRSNQGWWLLTRTLELRYLGAPVEETFGSLSAFACRSIDVDLKRGCARIMMQLGTEAYLLVYWYDTDRWSVDTLPPSHTWNDAIVIGDTYYVTDTDAVMKSSVASYEDGQHGLNRVYAMSVSTGWVRFDNMAQIKRVWREFLSCRKVRESGLQVLVFYDFGTSLTVNQIFLDADLPIDNSYTLRFHNAIQKVKALQVRVTDSQGANPPGPFSGQTAGFELYGLGFELGLKRGGAKQPAAQTR